MGPRKLWLRQSKQPKAIGDAVLAPFELYTCLLEITNLVNQRPIGRIPTDPDDGSYLCPNDILLGRVTSTIPEGSFRQTENPRHRFEFCQRIVEAFWKKWSRDVLPQLVPRKKWNAESRNVKVNDCVVLADPNALRHTSCYNYFSPGNVTFPPAMGEFPFLPSFVFVAFNWVYNRNLAYRT